MLRIVRLCGVLMVAGIAVSVAQCATGGSSPSPAVLAQPTSYLDCGTVGSSQPSQAQIGRAGGVIAAGPHMVVFPPGALPQDVNVSLQRLPSTPNNGRVGVHLRLQPEVTRFGNDVSVLLNVAGCSVPANRNWRVFRVAGNNPDGPGSPRDAIRTRDYFHIFTRDHSFLIIAD